MSQQGSSYLTSWTTAICDRKCLNIKCSRRLPTLWAFAGNPGTGNLTNWSIRGKDTTYVVGTYPFSSNPLVWGINSPCRPSMCCFRHECATVTPNSAQLTRNIFRYRYVAPSPATPLLYACSTHLPHINPGVNTTVLASARNLN